MLLFITDNQNADIQIHCTRIVEISSCIRYLHVIILIKKN